MLNDCVRDGNRWNHSAIATGFLAVNVSQSCGALRACILGTFSHATCYPIGFASWTGQQKVCMSIPSKLYRRQMEHFRVMAKLHMLSTFVCLAAACGGQRQPIALRFPLALLGRFRIRPVTQSASPLGQVSIPSKLYRRLNGTFQGDDETSHALRVCLP